METNDLLYKILEQCYVSEKAIKDEIAVKLGITPANLNFNRLRDMGLIRFDETNENWIYITPAGHSVYQKNLDQKHARVQAKENSIFSKKTIIISIIAIIIAMVSLYFTIWPYHK